VVSSPPVTKKIGAMGREVESRQGKGWDVALKNKYCVKYFFCLHKILRWNFVQCFCKYVKFVRVHSIAIRVQHYLTIFGDFDQNSAQIGNFHENQSICIVFVQEQLYCESLKPLFIKHF
jgi:hypothetical protein